MLKVCWMQSFFVFAAWVLAGTMVPGDASAQEFRKLDRPSDQKLKQELFSAMCAGPLTGSVAEPRCENVRGGKPEEAILKVAYSGIPVPGGDKIAVLSIIDPTGGFNFMQATALLRQKEGQGWVYEGYSAGSDTSTCEIIEIKYQKVLICTASLYGGGTAEHMVFALLPDKLKRSWLVTLEDQEGGCRYEGKFLEKMEAIVTDGFEKDSGVDFAVLYSEKTGKFLPKDREFDNAGDDCDIDDKSVWAVTIRKEARFFKLDLSGVVPVKVAANKVENSKVQEFMSGKNNASSNKPKGWMKDGGMKRK